MYYLFQLQINIEKNILKENWTLTEKCLAINQSMPTVKWLYIKKKCFKWIINIYSMNSRRIFNWCLNVKSNTSSARTLYLGFNGQLRTTVLFVTCKEQRNDAKMVAIELAPSIWKWKSSRHGYRKCLKMYPREINYCTTASNWGGS